MGNCCQSQCDCNSNSLENNGLRCKYCNSVGQVVKGVTVKSFVQKEWKSEIQDDDMFTLCMNPDCYITYYSYEKNLFFTIEDLTHPIWFKRGSIPKIICYCHRITEDMIREKVISDNLTSFRDIVLAYRKKVVCNCERLNPLGLCCTKYFYEVINKTLREIGKREVDVPDRCC